MPFSFRQRRFIEAKAFARFLQDLRVRHGLVSVEHLVGLMLRDHVAHPKSQLFEKFKQIWPAATAVGKLLKHEPEYRQEAQRAEGPDLDWFESKQGGSQDAEIASDLVICHAIRGSAHNKVAESNQLRLERLSLILLRGVVRAYVEASRRWSL